MTVYISHTDSPIAPPPTAPERRKPRVRIYDGQWSDSDFKVRKAQNVREQVLENLKTGIFSGSPFTASLEAAPLVGNTVFLCVFINSNAQSVTTPSGWTLVQSAPSAAGILCTVFYRATQEGDAATQAVTLSGTTSGGWMMLEMEGPITGSSPIDKTSSSSGTSTMISTGTTGATVTTPQLAIVVLAAASTELVYAPSGYTQVGPNVINVGSMIVAKRFLTTTGTQSASTSLRGSAPWAAEIFTLKQGTVRKYNPLGEFDAVKGRATRSPLQLGVIEGEVPTVDPASAHLKEGSIIEVYFPGDTVRAGWTFEWYAIREVTIDESRAVPYKIFRGLDLRCLIYDRPISLPIVKVTRATPPAVTTAEGWAREFVNVSCINITAQAYWPTTETVPGLALESTNGGRGTQYSTNPPAKAGATLGETITELYARDNLGWKLVVVNPGQTTGYIEFCTVNGTDRRIGQTGEALFATKFDTAASVVHTVSAVDSITAAVVRGKEDNQGSRAYFYVVDETARQKWGLIVGEVDASTEEYLTTEIAKKYLSERLPKEWVDVIPRETVALMVRRDYDLLDQATAITNTGARFDGYISEMSVSFRGGLDSPAFGIFPDTRAQSGEVPLPKNSHTVETDNITFTIGRTPQTAPDGGKDRLPAQLREAGTVNKQQALSAATIAGQTAGSQTIIQTTDPVTTPAATQASTQSAINALQQKYDDLVGKFNQLKDALKDTGAAVISS